jgi:hypothetical protein
MQMKLLTAIAAFVIAASMFSAGALAQCAWTGFGVACTAPVLPVLPPPPTAYFVSDWTVPVFPLAYTYSPDVDWRLFEPR